jgi:hypothetical protein
MNLHLATISLYLQHQMEKNARDSVSAVEAARWLDRAQILKDSKSRRGLPLRNLLRQGEILGQRQESNGRWFIDRVRGTQSLVLPID